MGNNAQNTKPSTLEGYFELQYPFNVVADPEGGYFVEVPDLPGCMTQADTLDEVIPMIEDARRAWIETAYELGREIPLPSYPEEYSGRFVLRLPRSLHRKLAEAAEREGVSLNSYAAEVLSRGDAQAQLERCLHKMEQQMDKRLAGIEEHIEEIRERYRPGHVPGPSSGRLPFQRVQGGYKDLVAA
jgi:predicted RNase H-like HicB family nuclease